MILWYIRSEMRWVFTLFLLIAPSAAFAYASLLQELRDPSRLTLTVIPAEIDAIPRGATNVPLLPLKLEASCDAEVEVKEIAVHRIGLGEADDIHRLYLLQGFRRLTRGVRFSSADQKAILRPRGLTIRPCESLRIDVAADFSQTAAIGGRSAAEIVSAGDIVTSAGVVTGDWPLRMAGGAPSITPDPVGQVTVTFLPLSGKVSATVDEELARFLIEADNVSHQMLYGITLTNRGTARGDDLRNLYLTRQAMSAGRQGRSLTQATDRMDDDAVTLEFSQPYFLRRGQRETFSLRGRAFTRDRTIAFTLEEPADLHALGTKLRGRTLGR